MPLETFPFGQPHAWNGGMGGMGGRVEEGKSEALASLGGEGSPKALSHCGKSARGTREEG